MSPSGRRSPIHQAISPDPWQGALCDATSASARFGNKSGSGYHEPMERTVGGVVPQEFIETVAERILSG
jgi:hypothetical protein